MDDEEFALAYCYYDYSNQDTLDALSIIGTIVQQLLIKQTAMDEKTASRLERMFAQGVRHPPCNDIVELLIDVAQRYRCVYILIDGLDEAAMNSQDEVMSMIRALCNSEDIVIKLYLSSREDPRFSKTLGSYLSLHISEDATAQDLSQYVEASIHDRLATHPVAINSPELLVDVRRGLTREAKGM